MRLSLTGIGAELRVEDGYAKIERLIPGGPAQMSGKVNVGDRILFGKYTGNDIKIDDQDYLILNEEEILAKFNRMAKAASSRK